MLRLSFAFAVTYEILARHMCFERGCDNVIDNTGFCTECAQPADRPGTLEAI